MTNLLLRRCFGNTFAWYRSEIVTSTNSGKKIPYHRTATLRLKRFGQPPVRLKTGIDVVDIAYSTRLTRIFCPLGTNVMT